MIFEVGFSDTFECHKVSIRKVGVEVDFLHFAIYIGVDAAYSYVDVKLLSAFNIESGDLSHSFFKLAYGAVGEELFGSGHVRFIRLGYDIGVIGSFS